MSTRLLFFGGSFDPVHHGHLIVARSIAEQLDCQRIVLVPAGQSPHKIRIFAPAADRLAMLKLAIEGQSLFEISDVELARTGPSYTIDTMEKLRRRHGPARLAWVIGADMLADLPKWRRAKELVEQFDMVIAARLMEQAELQAAFDNIQKFFGPEHTERLRQSVVQNPLLEISSTEIRGRIASGKSIAYLVPPAVSNYIDANNLYRGLRCST
jgi:nicotinate-nucleotide adenylyltransferase